MMDYCKEFGKEMDQEFQRLLMWAMVYLLMMPNDDELPAAYTKSVLIIIDTRDQQSYQWNKKKIDRYLKIMNLF